MLSQIISGGIESLKQRISGSFNCEQQSAFRSHIQSCDCGYLKFALDYVDWKRKYQNERCFWKRSSPRTASRSTRPQISGPPLSGTGEASTSPKINFEPSRNDA
jgi:hypothetical protein